MKRQGFTLVEIMIAVAILCIIMLIALPGLLRMRQNAVEAKTQAELSSLYKASTMFYLNSGRFPQNLSELKDYMNRSNIENNYELNPNL